MEESGAARPGFFCRVTTPAPIHDLAVIGAGPAGAAAAYHAARAGLRVALLDRAEFPRDKICGDGLTGRAVQELRRLELEEAVRRRGARIDRFDLRAPLGRVAALLQDAGSPGYAYVLPRRQLDAMLVERAVEAGATLLTPCEVRGWEDAGTALRLSVETPAGVTAVSARQVILATGAHSGLALRMRLLKRKPRSIVAIRQYVAAPGGPGDTWHLHFSPATLPGYGWIFPTSDGGANVGVGLEHRRGSVSLPELLGQYLHSREARRLLGDAAPRSAARSFPLRCDFLASPLIAPRILIAGEAAGLVNPLTGEGIDYALESGRLAAEHAARIVAGESGAAAAYAASLHDHYARLFAFSERLRGWCSNAWGVSALALGAMARPRLKNRLVGILLGDAPVPERADVARLVRALWQG